MKTYVSFLSVSFFAVLLYTETNAKTIGPGHTASSGSGIYMNTSDYRQGKLTLPVDCQHEKNRIRLHDFFGKPYITVIHEGEKHVYAKDAIFGLRDCEGHDFRFFHHQLFEIEELKSIVIYRHITIESGGSTKGIRQVTNYYFSTGVDSEIMPLTRSALERAFPHNDKIHDLLEAQFHGDRDDVSTYDSFHHTFKINRLLQASI